MSRQIWFIVIAFVFLSIRSEATILIVNNNLNYPIDHVTSFDNLLDAYNAAFSGDTLYIAGSIDAYQEQLYVAKTLHFFGPGFFLNENSETQVSPYEAYLSSSINFMSESEGSTIMGLSLRAVWIETSNITVKRNWIDASCGISSNPIYAENIVISQNYINGSVYIQYNCRNTIITNNSVGDIYINSTDSYNIIVRNNIVRGQITLRNAIVECNIMLYTTAGVGIDLPTCSVCYNVCAGNLFPADCGNLLNVDMDSVFVCPPFQTCTASTDGRWQLSTNSVAKGVCQGEDAGMFGGPEPYILSGLPPIPAIFYFSGEGITTDDSLNIHIKMKSHN